MCSVNKTLHLLHDRHILLCPGLAPTAVGAGDCLVLMSDEVSSVSGDGSESSWVNPHNSHLVIFDSVRSSINANKSFSLVWFRMVKALNLISLFQFFKLLSQHSQHISSCLRFKYITMIDIAGVLDRMILITIALKYAHCLLSSVIRKYEIF